MERSHHVAEKKICWTVQLIFVNFMFVIDELEVFSLQQYQQQSVALSSG